MKLKKKLTITALLIILFILMLFPYGGWLLLLIVLAGFITRKYHAKTRPLAFGLIVLFLVFLVGFYRNSTFVGEFDNGGTWIPDHGISTAFEYFLSWSQSFTASFYGYSCNSVYGVNCSEGLLVLGAATNTVIIAGSYYFYPAIFKKTRLAAKK